jgi:Ca2+/Na+ antiporter
VRYIQRRFLSQATDCVRFCSRAAVVCDDHFCDSLEVICQQLRLPEAVAGATFMAAGSSAPELATSLVAVFTTRDATGLGTILGSAVFNLVAIICLSGIFGSGPAFKLTHKNKEWEDENNAAVQNLPFTKELKVQNAKRQREGKSPISSTGLYLDWRPLGRDAIFYIVALALCVTFALTSVGSGWKDPQFNDKPGFVWYEGLILCICYAVYVQSMVKNKELMEWAENKIGMQDHIKLYLDELDKLENDDDGDDPRDPEEPTDAVRPMVRWGGTSAHGHGAPPSSAAPHPTGTTAAETAGLLDKPAEHAAPTPGASAGDIEEVVTISQDSLQSAVLKSNSHLEARIQALQARLDALEKKPYKWEYKRWEEEDAPECLDIVMGWFEYPWKLAFQMTIPACDRDAFQEWDEEKIAFTDLDKEAQELLTANAESEMVDKPKDTDAFFRGKYKKSRVSRCTSHAHVRVPAVCPTDLTVWVMAGGLVVREVETLRIFLHDEHRLDWTHIVGHGEAVKKSCREQLPEQLPGCHRRKNWLPFRCRAFYHGTGGSCCWHVDTRCT